MSHLRSFDRVADVYDETRSLPPDAEASIADEIALELRRLTPAPHVIEIGIGTGRIAIPLAERGVRVVGFDISPKMLFRLRQKREDVDICLAEAANPPLKDGVFDAALFVHVLHLVPDVASSVVAGRALVHDRGMLIFGSDDEQTGVREEADRAIRETVRNVTGIEMTGWKPYEESANIARQILEQAGARLTRTTVARWTAHTNAKRHVERLARRDYSSAWEIPDDHLHQVVERVAPLLRDIYGSWEGDREYPRSFSLTVARLG
jgi:ubiquinone/menaquinone biosynthesis C-methylase UbiE